MYSYDVKTYLLKEKTNVINVRSFLNTPIPQNKNEEFITPTKMFASTDITSYIIILIEEEKCIEEPALQLLDLLPDAKCVIKEVSDPIVFYNFLRRQINLPQKRSITIPESDNENMNQEKSDIHQKSDMFSSGGETDAFSDSLERITLHLKERIQEKERENSRHQLISSSNLSNTKSKFFVTK